MEISPWIFFYGLDSARYAAFNVSTLNVLTSGSVTQPVTLNEMYLLANQWVKTTGSRQAGLATTFVTKLDMPTRPVKKKGQRQTGESEKIAGGQEQTPKPKRDPATVKCFECGEKGHYARDCPTKQATEEQVVQQENNFQTWEEKKKKMHF
jgi:hypothetical protein